MGSIGGRAQAMAWTAAQRCLGRCMVGVRGRTQRMGAQVVVLGSGLDSRPWRLALPPGVTWFEVPARSLTEASRSLKVGGCMACR